jgi:hypothetical protein
VRRALGLGIVAAVAFTAIVLTRLPAAWVLPAAASRACATVDGTIWNGACGGLLLGRIPLGDLTWELQPARLLGGALAAHVVLAHGAASVRADAALGFGGRITLRNLVADAALDPALFPQLPHKLRGTAHAELALARIERGRITELQGRLEARDLEDRSNGVTPLGSYAVTFPGGPGEPTGRVQDLGGPLAVEGTLRLTGSSGYDLEGQVAARPGAAPELVGSLQYLGSPDALGRRPFSLAGTL